MSSPPASFPELLSMEQLLKQDPVWQALKPGELVDGVVMHVSSAGILVHFGGKSEGMVVPSEMQSVSAEELLAIQVGSRLLTSVVRPETETGPVILSLDRARLQQGWQLLEQAQVSGGMVLGRVVEQNRGGVVVDREGQLVTGTVTSLAPFGAFALVDGKVEGLIHISELSSQRITHPREAVHEGDVLDLKILQIDPERRRLRLSLRQVVAES